MKIYKFLFCIIICAFITQSSQSQKSSETNFYYYKGEKVFLEVDYSTISVSLEDQNASSLKSVSLNHTLSKITKDHTRSIVTIIDQKAKLNKNKRAYYTELVLKKRLSKVDYNKQIRLYDQMSGILKASPSFLKGGEKVGVSNNFYVKLKNKDDIKTLYDKAKEVNVEVLGHNKYMPLWFTISVNKKSNLNAVELANIFYETGLFVASEPAFIYHNLQLSNDILFSDQWYLKNTGQNGGISGIDINIEQAWGITSGLSNIKTAIYDQGLDLSHPDLQDNIASSYDATTGASPSIVRGRHGTACGGIVGAIKDNTIGISGVAPTARLMSVSTNLLISDTPQQLADGFNWAWQNGADIISNSWGGYAPSSIIDDAITNTLTNGRDGKGTVVVFAAGNENNTNIRYPGNSNPKILLVGAMSPCGERKNPNSCDGEQWGSCFGDQLDIMAPGVKMTTTDLQREDGYTEYDYTKTFNGTSSACPVVAGVAALVLSVNPNLTNVEVNTIIESTAQKIRTDLYTYETGKPNGTWNFEMGYGLVDAYQAVLAAQQQGCIIDLAITQDVTSGQTDIQQASNSIIVKNIISNNAIASYDAGLEVTLGPNFDAALGSDFMAFIEGCSSVRQNNYPTTQNKNIQYSFIENGPKKLGAHKNNSEFIVYPNPTSDKLIINYPFKEKTAYDIEIFNYAGTRVFSSFIYQSNLILNLNHLEKGLYFIKLIDGKEVMTQKILISK